jgi:phage major head subunit gpT-like protein
VYALGFIITREIFDDDQYDIVGQRKAQGLAFSMRQTKEIVAANVYNRAFNSSYTGGDGVSLINTSHPNIAGGTWSNQIAVAADLSEAALEQASIDIMGFTDDRGLKIMVKPQKLIVPKELTFEATRLLGTEGRPGTANNDLNALKSKGVFKELAINQYLTDPDAWFIKTDAPDGLKYFERRAMEFVNEPDFDTDNAKYKATERYSFGWSDARACYGSAGA